MARISYGLQVQKRAKCLLKSILAYANDEFDVCNEAVVDAIRPNIQVRWLTEKRLVVRTKVRFLQELTGLQGDETPLKAEQVKEEFIASSQSDFDTWNAAYSLGNFFDPGNKIAISTLEQIITSFYHENFRLQAADSLGKVEPGNSIAITALIKIIESTKKESIRRKAAFSLGKCHPENQIAISTLEKIITTSTNKQQKQYAVENLLTLAPENKLALAVNVSNKNTDKTNKSTQQRKLRNKSRNHNRNSQKAIAALVEGIAAAKNDDSKRRRASSLGKLEPHNQLAFDTLIDLLKSAKKDSDRKNAAEDLKKIIDNEQMPKLIASLKSCFYEESKHCYKLLWFCAEKMNYGDFYRAWNGEE